MNHVGLLELVKICSWNFASPNEIIATSNDLTPKGSWGREIPLFQGNLGWWNIIIWPNELKKISSWFSAIPKSLRFLGCRGCFQENWRNSPGRWRRFTGVTWWHLQDFWKRKDLKPDVGIGWGCLVMLPLLLTATNCYIFGREPL